MRPPPALAPAPLQTVQGTATRLHVGVTPTAPPKQDPRDWSTNPPPRLARPPRRRAHRASRRARHRPLARRRHANGAVAQRSARPCSRRHQPSGRDRRNRRRVELPRHQDQQKELPDGDGDGLRRVRSESDDRQVFPSALPIVPMAAMWAGVNPAIEHEDSSESALRDIRIEAVVRSVAPVGRAVPVQVWSPSVTLRTVPDTDRERKTPIPTERKTPHSAASTGMWPATSSATPRLCIGSRSGDRTRYG